MVFPLIVDGELETQEPKKKIDIEACASKQTGEMMAESLKY
jgi:hypothetical protein